MWILPYYMWYVICRTTLYNSMRREKRILQSIERNWNFLHCRGKRSHNCVCAKIFFTLCAIEILPLNYKLGVIQPNSLSPITWIHYSTIRKISPFSFTIVHARESCKIHTEAFVRNKTDVLKLRTPVVSRSPPPPLVWNARDRTLLQNQSANS